LHALEVYPVRVQAPRGARKVFALPDVEERPLAGLGGEVSHQVLVGVAQQVVALRPVGREVQVGEDPDEVREPFKISLTATLGLAPYARLYRAIFAAYRLTFLLEQ
jgi:hypothetical protein